MLQESLAIVDISGGGLRRLGGLASLVSNNVKLGGKGNGDKGKKKVRGGDGKAGFDLEGVCKDFGRWEDEFEERTGIKTKGGNWM